MNQKHVFWEALLLAIFIFASGILLGYFLELNRTSKIITSYQEAELGLLDVRVQENLISIGNFNCEQSIKETIDFADRIYKEAQVLEKYEESARLSTGILFQHKKYDLLRATLWSNALKIKEKCPNSFHTVVYMYQLDSKDVEVLSKQKAFSNYLFELKNEYSDNLLLIPMAGNLDLNSIEFLKNIYGLDVLPVILIDEKIKIETLEDLGNIRNFLK